MIKSRTNQNMMPLTRAAFFSNRKGTKNLSKAEKNRRYASYLNSFESKGSRRGRGKASSGAKIDECVLGYAKSLINPFEGPSPCSPHPPSLPSQTMRLYRKTSLFTSSTTQTGYALLYGNIASDGSPFLVSTNSSFGGTSMVLGTGTVSGYSNSPFTTADFSADKVSWRIVSMGLRVRYAGTELNRGGRIFLLEHPSNGSLYGLDAAGMLAYPSCRTEPVSREWHSITLSPVSPEVLDFGKTEFAISNPLGILIVAPDTTPLLFEVEAVINIELVGPLAKNLSPSPSNVQGASDVISLVKGFSDGYTLRDVVQGVQSMSGLANTVRNLWNTQVGSGVGRMIGL